LLLYTGNIENAGRRRTTSGDSRDGIYRSPQRERRAEDRKKAFLTGLPL
jgi:hypothetical protein